MYCAQGVSRKQSVCSPYISSGACHTSHNYGDVPTFEFLFVLWGKCWSAHTQSRRSSHGKTACDFGGTSHVMFFFVTSHVIYKNNHM